MKKRVLNCAANPPFVPTQVSASAPGTNNRVLERGDNERRNLRRCEMRFDFLRNLLLVFVALFCHAAHAQIPSQKTAKAKTNYTISAEKYAAELRASITKIDRWQSGALPTLPVMRNALPTSDERRIKREDGATQTASGVQWDRYLDSIEYSGNAKARLKRNEVQVVREMMAQRLLALQNWMKIGDYQAAGAQNIISTLEDENQIRTGPTAMQAWWQSVKDAIGDFFSKLFVRSATRATPSQMPNINPNWANWLFTSCVLCLLGAIAWYVWKALGGRWVRNAKREVRFVGEDAELLQLAPEELLSRAGRLAQKGDYAGALRHRFIGLLVTLDERGVWRYDTRRTNWEHIAALRKTPRWNFVSTPLSDLTRRFDRVRYGNIPCAQNDWLGFDSDSADLEKQIAQPLQNTTSSTGNPQMGARA